MIDFDALVLGPAMDAFASPAMLLPLVSNPGAAAQPVRGAFRLKPSDIVDPETGNLRADDYTFGVRASEFAVLAARGDLVFAIQHPSFQRFLQDAQGNPRVFVIDDTGDDGYGFQQWILREQRAEDDEP
jgi:hypothetical protein